MQHCCGHVSKKPTIDRKLIVLLAIIISIFVVNVMFGIFNKLSSMLVYYLEKIWLPLLIGILISGIIDRYVPRKYIAKNLSANDIFSIPKSVIAGFLASTCSHGILAIAMELYRKGASTSSIIAFLLASPWANFAVTLLLFSFFGIKAILFILSAISIAIFTGYIYLFLERKGIVESNKTINPHLYLEIDLKKDNTKRKILDDIKHILRSSWEVGNMILFWALFGVFLAAIIGTYTPTEVFMEYLGPSITGLILTLVIATIIEVCSEGTAPLAFEIYRQTGAFGNAFVFLMAGVVTDYTEIGIIWSNIGKRTAILLPLITVPQVLLLGYLFNMF